jgi:hypothetical protein
MRCNPLNDWPQKAPAVAEAMAGGQEAQKVGIEIPSMKRGGA